MTRLCRIVAIGTLLAAGCAARQSPPAQVAPAPVVDDDEQRMARLRLLVGQVMEVPARVTNVLTSTDEAAVVSSELEAAYKRAASQFDGDCEEKPTAACRKVHRELLDVAEAQLRHCAVVKASWNRVLDLNVEVVALNQSLSDLEPECQKMLKPKIRAACDELSWEGKGRLQFKDDAVDATRRHLANVDRLCALDERKAGLLRERDRALGD